MIQSNSDIWKDYTRHVLKWEGKTSNDPRDTTAAKCVNKGQIHTNKGVTFCTFKQLAGKLGITPITHARFLKLTDYEVGLFIYDFFQKNNPSRFSDRVALSLTEARWLSGSRAIEHLQKVVKQPVTGVLNEATIQAANNMDETELLTAYWQERDRFFKGLKNAKTYYNGWKNRMVSFLSIIDVVKKKSFNPFSFAFMAGRNNNSNNIFL